MLEERNLKLDLFALGLLALTVFLALALFTYDAADPPSTLIYPAGAEVTNVCGIWGAWAVGLLLKIVGIGAYYLVLSLAVADSVLLARGRLTEPVLRLAGWLLSLIGLTTLAAMALPGLSPGPVIGPGGYLGAMGRHLLESNFASVGAYVLVVSFIASGLLLCTDYVLVSLAAWMVATPSRRVGSTFARAHEAYRLRTAGGNADTDAEEEDEYEYEEEDEYEEEEEETADEPVIRIMGEDNPEAEDSDEEEEEEKEEDAEDSNSSAKPSKGVKTRLARALGIRRTKSSPQREEILEELEAASRHEPDFDYDLPSPTLLLENDTSSSQEQKKDVRRKAKILEKTFANFGFQVKVVAIETGPVIAQFEVELEAGLRLSKITGLSDDLAIALRVPSVRIVAPIPGKNTVGIEVPNAQRQMVRLREVMEEANGSVKKMRIPIFLGKDVSGKPLTVDLATLPHLLIAGRTGTGKSVCLNAIIMSILMTRSPEDVRMLMIDPKMVELSPYMRLPHLMHPVITDMNKAEAILAWAVDKMDERYTLLARAGVRHISIYNQLGEEELMDRLKPKTDEEREQIPRHLPYIVIIADEIADLMMTAAKEVESHIIRLAQKSRAVGIHLVLATQKPTVDVITGLIKSNLPARVSFQVATRTDSRVVLDEMGADKLLGNGDLLFLWPGTSMLLRGQGAFVSDDEVSRVVECVGTSDPQFVRELVQLPAAGSGPNSDRFSSRDELYVGAVDVVVREQRGSVSLLQRTLGIGYGRAARLIDFMAEDGIVGQYNGAQAREVLIDLDQWEAMQGQPSDPEPLPLPPPNPRNQTVPVDEVEEVDEDEEDVEDATSEEVDEEEEEEELEDEEEVIAEEEEYEEEDEGAEDEYEEEDSEEEDEYEEEDALEEEEEGEPDEASDALEEDDTPEDEYEDDPPKRPRRAKSA